MAPFASDEMDLCARLSEVLADFKLTVPVYPVSPCLNIIGVTLGGDIY